MQRVKEESSCPLGIKKRARVKEYCAGYPSDPASASSYTRQKQLEDASYAQADVAANLSYGGTILNSRF
ncbi:hypothetical protein ACFLVX_00925 [Chloroflexota bacterium]